MHHRSALLTFILILCLCNFAQSQEFVYGFRVGLNFSTFQGPSQKDADGNELESLDNNTGFHVGANFSYKFYESFGIRTGLLYSQRGGEYLFEGQSYQILLADSGERVAAFGQRKDVLSVTNSYLEIPFVAYGKFFEKLEVFGGAGLNFLIGSRADGERQFNGISAINSQPVDFTVALNHLYFSDDVPTPEFIREFTMPNMITADGEVIFIPESFNGYYDYPEKDGSIYNIVDITVLGGLAYYLNRGLFVSVSAHLGLLDVTNETYDFSKTELNGLEYVPQDDKDNNFFIQASIGFSF
ncbi:MAG: outer membrane beta-barrel protein [Bacteroidota bacterium]